MILRLCNSDQNRFSENRAMSSRVCFQAGWLSLHTSSREGSLSPVCLTTDSLLDLVASTKKDKEQVKPYLYHLPKIFISFVPVSKSRACKTGYKVLYFISNVFVSQHLDPS